MAGKKKVVDMPVDDPIKDEYEIMPRMAISNIKRELAALKKRAGVKGAAVSDDLKDNVNRLNRSIEELLMIFKEAAEGMKLEEGIPAADSSLEPIIKRLDLIESENRKIAEAILVIGDMLKEVRFREKRIEHGMHEIPGPSFAFRNERPAAQTPAPQKTAPQMQMPPFMPPPMQMPPFMPSQSIQPQRTGAPMPPSRMPEFSSLPPLPDIRMQPRKGVFSKMFKK